MITIAWVVMAFALLVIAVVQFCKELRVSEAENAERGRRRVVQEDHDILSGKSWLANNPVCPECGTGDGRRRTRDGKIILLQECMEVRYSYCPDPHHWHAANCTFGTYSGITHRDALIRIGERLRRRQ